MHTAVASSTPGEKIFNISETSLVEFYKVYADFQNQYEKVSFTKTDVKKYKISYQKMSEIGRMDWVTPVVDKVALKAASGVL